MKFLWLYYGRFMAILRPFSDHLIFCHFLPLSWPPQVKNNQFLGHFNSNHLKSVFDGHFFFFFKVRTTVLWPCYGHFLTTSRQFFFSFLAISSQCLLAIYFLDKDSLYFKIFVAVLWPIYGHFTAIFWPPYIFCHFWALSWPPQVKNNQFLGHFNSNHLKSEFDGHFFIFF